MVTFHFIPYHEIEDLASNKRISKLLGIVRQNKIVLLEGRLKKEEETGLIKNTMTAINEKFQGIELAVVYPEKDRLGGLKRLKYDFANLLLGDRQGVTIIGPASIVKRVKQNPSSIELFTQDKRKRRK